MFDFHKVESVFRDINSLEDKNRATLDTSSPERNFLFIILKHAFKDALEYSLSSFKDPKIESGLKAFLSDDPKKSPEFNLKTVCTYLFNSDTVHLKIKARMLKLINN